MPSRPTSSTERLAEEAAQSLTEALELISAPRQPARRERVRALLALAIERAELCVRGSAAASERSVIGARSVLARAQAARAEDALRGAGQLSRSAQRAPTPRDCDEGWLSVESIVGAAEDAARAAASAALGLDQVDSGPARAACAAAGRAKRAAQAARRLVEDRNHAYTFHTDDGFSFGEGWYLAAAAVLGGVTIQIEPGQRATPQAERFLRDAGLGDRLQAPRPRPRANKQTTDVVARAFRHDPLGAQRKVRAAFLGDSPISESVRSWIDPRLAECRERKKVLVWSRDGVHHAGRNTVASELVEMAERVKRADMVPIVVGDPLRSAPVPTGAIDMIHFWKDPIFRGVEGRRAQLMFFEHLREAHAVVGQIGVTTAGMDGPALVGMPTMYLTEVSNVRMREWVGAVPGYREIVRGADYVEQVGRGLLEWAGLAAVARPGIGT